MGPDQQQRSQTVAMNGARPPSSLAYRCERLRYVTSRAPQFLDITEGVRTTVQRVGLMYGFVVVFSRHTTAAVRVNEAEPLLLQDMEALLARIAPAGVYYRHNDLAVRTVNRTEEEDMNGHAHCQHLLLGASETIPVEEGELLLGRWQRIFLVELDRPRPREVIVQACGV